jgi:hypothetical protein
MDFASWLTDIMARNRSTYVLGGQATLFRIKHLQQVTVDHERNSPWDPDAQVEDMELTWRLHEAGRKTLVSATARAYAGTMVTVKGLMGQRRKWDEGMAALVEAQDAGQEHHDPVEAAVPDDVQRPGSVAVRDHAAAGADRAPVRLVTRRSG